MKALLAALALLGVAACGPASAGRADRVGDVDTASRVIPGSRVVDDAHLLTDADGARLNAKLKALEVETTDQLVVVSVPTLKGETIERYTLALANRWGIGRADVDNGVVILVAPNERRVRVGVGIGLEGLLTDAKAADVVAAMVARFRQRDYAGGLETGVDLISGLLRSDRRRPQPKPVQIKEAA